ncbi:hypothetical protein [Terricaulis sp.]|uniref:hypothetical protein n=1 Tax=Terricaulis sp. TaxID=2768686 RepID=UPI003782E11D
MPRLARYFGALALALILTGLSASPAHAQADRPGCATDSNILICVTSAAVTYERTTPYDEIVADVSVTLRITNQSDYPVGIGVLSDSFAFTPQNADTLTVRGGADVSGVQECRRASDCEWTIIAPGRPALLQVSYRGQFSGSGLQLMQIARTASFSATLAVDERGETRLVSLPLEGFVFGNGLGGATRRR